MDEVALVTPTLTTEMYLGTLLTAGSDELHDALFGSVRGGYIEIYKRETYVILLLRNLGTLVDIGAERVTKLDLAGLFGEPAQEFVVDLRVDENTRSSAASLAMIPAVDRS